MDQSKPIGIFDSGVGGLTVYKELKQLLPNERFIYLGDTARVPYGTKSKDIVIKYALQDSLFLLEKEVKFIVVACNTASAFALEFLQDRLRVPVMGVIEPGARAAVSVTANNRVGIIGTEGTIGSQAYENKLKALSDKIICFSKATGLFVPLVEEAITQDEILHSIFDHYLKDFKANDIDTLILGCTHYPLLKSALKEYFGKSVTLVDSAVATAKVVQKELERTKLASSKPSEQSDELNVTDSPERVQKIAHHFLGNGQVPIIKADLVI